MAKLGLSLQWKDETTHINQSIYILHEQIKRQNHMLVLTDGGKTLKKDSTFFMNETQQSRYRKYLLQISKDHIWRQEKLASYLLGLA